MSSLADLPEIIGFFSYSREDDESFKSGLSGLREAIQHELAAQLGRSKATFRLWQDKEAIAPGRLWEEEIKVAVGQSVFFIPIVTPRTIKSDYCKFEFEAFLARERELGRADLVFPIIYIPVPALASEPQWRNHPVLSIIGRRQYVDWQTFRHVDVPTPAMREEIARFCRKIVEALHASWLSPEERKQREEAEVAARVREAEARQRSDAVTRSKREAEQERTAAIAARARSDGSGQQNSKRGDESIRQTQVSGATKAVASPRANALRWIVAVATCLLLIGGVYGGWRLLRSPDAPIPTPTATQQPPYTERCDVTDTECWLALMCGKTQSTPCNYLPVCRSLYTAVTKRDASLAYLFRQEDNAFAWSPDNNRDCKWIGGPHGIMEDCVKDCVSVYYAVSGDLNSPTVKITNLVKK
jgi:hypothetical protein